MKDFNTYYSNPDLDRIVKKIQLIKSVTEKAPFNFKWKYTDEQLPKAIEETRNATSRAANSVYATFEYPESAIYLVHRKYNIEFRWMTTPRIFIDIPYGYANSKDTLDSFRRMTDPKDLIFLAGSKLFHIGHETDNYDLFGWADNDLKQRIDHMSSFYRCAGVVAQIDHTVTPQDIIFVLKNSDIGFTLKDEIELKLKFGIHVDINEISNQIMFDLI